MQNPFSFCRDELDNDNHHYFKSRVFDPLMKKREKTGKGKDGDKEIEKEKNKKRTYIIYIV